MEDKKLPIKKILWFPHANDTDVKAAMEELKTANLPNMLLYRNHIRDAANYCVVMLDKFYDADMDNWYQVVDSKQIGGIRYLTISAKSLRSFLMRLVRLLDMDLDTDTDTALDSIFEEVAEIAEPVNPFRQFLTEYTPATLTQLLEDEVMGQPELTRATADFLYYHVLRQLHPELPPRPLLITGPSGSGKTEVWRVIQKHFGDFLPIRIMDGSNLSCEGWSGNYKLETFIDSRVAQGGILVVDEFDKLTRPKFSSGGSNVSNDMQAEFLKLMEGEYQLTHNKKLTGKNSRLMGLVLVGAFEVLRNSPDKQEPTVAPIGFCGSQSAKQEQKEITDEALIGYGIMPEIVGRIAMKCQTQYLSDETYMDIICSPHSRVAVLKQVLRECGVDVEQLLSKDELRALIAQSKSNRTGVRWVAAQVETRLLESIREQGLFRTPQEPRPPKKQPIPA